MKKINLGRISCLITAFAISIATASAGSLNYTTTWLGNSFGGGPEWVQNFAEDLYLFPDGTMMVGSFWDEAGREVGFYKDGKVVGQLADTHLRGGYAVTATENYCFYAHTCALENQPQAKAGEVLPDKVLCYFGVSRYTREGKHAPFPGGKTRFGNMLSFREARNNHDLVPRGAANDGKFLYVSDTAFNSVKVLDIESMALVREFPVARPEKLRLDPAGNLWIVCGERKRIESFTREGKSRGVNLIPHAGCVIGGLGFDQHGHLLVCDNGPDQQIEIYDIHRSPPRHLDCFGVEGGMFAGPSPGSTGPLRLAGPTGVGVDAKGNWYICCHSPGGGAILRAFSPRKKLLWELLGLELVDVADAHPDSDGTDVFTATGRYRMDYAKPAGQGWKWRALTLDPFRYRHDLRQHIPVLQCGTSVRKLNGQTFLCQRGMWQGVLGIYRVEGNLAVPSVVLSAGPVKAERSDWRPPGQPDKGRWFWRDLDGDGQMEPGEYETTTGPEGEYWASNVDAAGDIWQGGRDTGIWRWRFQGLDKRKNPVYTAKAEHSPMPPPFTDLLRTEYLPATDTMYLTGQTQENPITGGEWGTAGTEVLRFDRWSGERKLRYRAVLPYEKEKTFAVSFCVAGDLFFAVTCKTAEVLVYDNRTGQRLGSMKPGPEVHGESGWVDFRDALRALRRHNGDYLVFVEEDWKGKCLVYQLQDPLHR